MKRSNKSVVRWITVSLMVLCMALPAFAAGKEAAKKEAAKVEPTTVTGMVVEKATDASGNVTAVAIKTAEGVEIGVAAKAGKGAELLKLVGKQIEAVGTVKKAKDKSTISVTEFKTIEAAVAAPAAAAPAAAAPAAKTAVQAAPAAPAAAPAAAAPAAPAPKAAGKKQ